MVVTAYSKTIEDLPALKAGLSAAARDISAFDLLSARELDRKSVV